jgi:hypothetical protein
MKPRIHAYIGGERVNGLTTWLAKQFRSQINTRTFSFIWYSKYTNQAGKNVAYIAHDRDDVKEEKKNKNDL